MGIMSAIFKTTAAGLVTEATKELLIPKQDSYQDTQSQSQEAAVKALRISKNKQRLKQNN